MKNFELFEGQSPPRSPEEISEMIRNSRREFMMKSTIGILGIGMSGVLGINIGRYFLSPIWEEAVEGFIPICSLEALKEGEPISLDYVKRKKDGWETHDVSDSMWLLRQEKNVVIAFDKSCTHLGCPYNWSPDEGVFKCPCHTATFSKTGEVLSGPPERPLDRYPVRVENNMVYVKPEVVRAEKTGGKKL